MKCPVCDTLNTSMLCPRCGFDGSRDYTRYPTFGIVPSAATASSLRQEREAGRRAADPEKQQLLDRVAELEKQLRFMTATTQQLMEKLEAPAPRTDKPVPPPAPIPAKPAASKKRNRLMKDSPKYLYSATVFGSKLRRSQVASVTFLDTLADAPKNTWDVSADKSGSVLAWAVPSAVPYNRCEEPLYDLFLAANGEIEAPKSCAYLFAKYYNMRRIHFGNCFNTSNVSDMHSMFSKCSSLTTLGLRSFDTSNVQSMDDMFFGCSSLTSLDLRNFDTSNVQSMASMFSGCSSLTTLGLRSFDTSNVQSMARMFSGCSSLTALDLRSFDTSNVQNMVRMFSECSYLKTLDLRSFDTAKVQHMEFMFNYCKSLTTLKRGRGFVTDGAKTDGMYNECNISKKWWNFLK